MSGATGTPPTAKAPDSYAQWSSSASTPWAQIEDALRATYPAASSSAPAADDEEEYEDGESDGSAEETPEESDA